MIRCCDLRPVLIIVLSILVLPFVFWGNCRTEAADFAGDIGDRHLNFALLTGYGEGEAGLELELQSGPNALSSGEAVDRNAGRRLMPPRRAAGPESPAPAGRVVIPRAQEPDPELEWEKRYGGSYDDFIRFVQQTRTTVISWWGIHICPATGGATST